MSLVLRFIFQGLRSYYYDADTGFYYLQSRYYDPKIGRFINADSLVSTGQGLLGYNMFAYCRNNPVCRIDVSGREDMECTDLDANDFTDDEDLMGGGNPGSGSTTGSSSGNGGGGYSGTVTGNGGHCGGSGGQITLYRAVSPAEYSSAVETQQFAAGDNSYESAKYFATSYADASKWGDAMYPDGNYQVIQATMDSQILGAPDIISYSTLDGIGPAYLIPLSALNTYVVCIY